MRKLLMKFPKYNDIHGSETRNTLKWWEELHLYETCLQSRNNFCCRGTGSEVNIEQKEHSGQQ